jgi:hypothetical protein
MREYDQEDMAMLEGQPLSVVIGKIGLAIEERKIAGMKAYIWGSPGILTNGAKESAKFGR